MEIVEGNHLTEDNGIIELTPLDLSVTPNLTRDDGVYWIAEDSHNKGRKMPRKRRRRGEGEEAKEVMEREGGVGSTLQVWNSLPSIRFFSASLSSSLLLSTASLPSLPLLSLSRSLSECSPNLPPSLGNTFFFHTLTALIPPQSRVTICRSAHPQPESVTGGLVYILSSDTPHPSPNQWKGHVIGFPLGPPPPPSPSPSPSHSLWWLCTQGFGGRGHHRGPSSHHSFDFACDAATPLIAVGNGTISFLSDWRTVGGPHIDLLPEANVVRLKLDSGVVAIYVHLMPHSVPWKVGDRVREGDVIGLSGNTGTHPIVS